MLSAYSDAHECPWEHVEFSAVATWGDVSETVVHDGWTFWAFPGEECVAVSRSASSAFGPLEPAGPLPRCERAAIVGAVSPEMRSCNGAEPAKEKTLFAGAMSCHDCEDA